MPHSHFARPAALCVLFILITVTCNYGEQPRPSPEPEYVRGKIVRMQIDVKFKANPYLSGPDHPVGDEIVWWKPPLFVLFLGDKPDAPLEKCREVYVEELFFLFVKIGDKFQPKTGLIKVQPPPRH